jgi:hypothetical protein
MNEPTSILALPSVRQLTEHFENCTYRALAESIHVTKSYDQSTALRGCDERRTASARISLRRAGTV